MLEVRSENMLLRLNFVLCLYTNLSSTVRLFTAWISRTSELYYPLIPFLVFSLRGVRWYEIASSIQSVQITKSHYDYWLKCCAVPSVLS